MTNDHPTDDRDLREAGERLRSSTTGLSPDAIRAGALRRRNRQLTVLGGVALVAVAVLGGLLVTTRRGEDRPGGSGDVAATDGEVAAILADLADEPVDPTTVRFVSSISSFDSCPALLDDLRNVGAAHVGSRGFGAGYWWGMPYLGVDEAAASGDVAMDGDGNTAETSALPLGDDVQSLPRGEGGADDDTTLGTNVQVEGVDEPDHVKAEGGLIYDLGLESTLRIIDASDGEILSTTVLTDRKTADVSSFVVHDGRVVVFGSEHEISEPIDGDRSASRVVHDHLTVTLVDATDPAAPSVVDRVRIDGHLVSARLVGDEIRLVSGSHLADIGFVMPTTGNSVRVALDANRRTVAASEITDWIPNWESDGGATGALVPCENVHVPDVFAGVSMTSMVTFPVDAEGFEPSATGILAPSDTVYAGVDRVAVSSGVWVDPIDREEGRYRFDEWESAVHEFRFDDADGAPAYVGSGLIEGSTIDQFGFGEIGDDLAVISTAGTPWGRRSPRRVHLSIFEHAGGTTLEKTGDLDFELGDVDWGHVNAVRFVEDRILVASGRGGGNIQVIDVSDPSAVRFAGSIDLDGGSGYIHPIGEGRVLAFSSRWRWHGLEEDHSWVTVHLLDVSDADAPAVLDTWSRMDVSHLLEWDHHAFTWWGERDLALWGLSSTIWPNQPPNEAAVLRAETALDEVAVVEVTEPPVAEPPCSVKELDESEQRLVGRDTVILTCDDPDLTVVAWSGHRCDLVDVDLVEEFEPGESEGRSHFWCNEADPPMAQRVLVVEGTPILYTDQTLERLDPDTFESTALILLPGGAGS